MSDAAEIFKWVGYGYQAIGLFTVYRWCFRVAKKARELESSYVEGGAEAVIPAANPSNAGVKLLNLRLKLKVLRLKIANRFLKGRVLRLEARTSEATGNKPLYSAPCPKKNVPDLPGQKRQRRAKRERIYRQSGPFPH